MASVPAVAAVALPTNLVPLPRLLAYVQTLGLERFLACLKRDIPTLVLALVWLALAWRGTGRPQHVSGLDEPLLAALLGRPRLPSATTLYRSRAHFAAHDLRAAVEATYLAELAQRVGRIWVALDSHQVPYWGRGKQGGAVRLGVSHQPALRRPAVAGADLPAAVARGAGYRRTPEWA